MLIYAGRVSLYGFLSPILSIFIVCYSKYACIDSFNFTYNLLWLIPMYYFCIYLYLKFTLKDFIYEVSSI